MALSKLFILVAAALFVASATAQSCDPNFGLDTFNPNCDDRSAPYCRRTVQGATQATSTYECVRCRTSCDCDLGQYCSTAPEEYGECRKFSKEGSSCRPLSTAQIRNQAIPDEWKCAETYINQLTNTTVIDQQGVCVEGKCRECDYNDGSGLRSCGVDDGTGPTRVCIYPGNLHNPHTAPWNSKLYYGQIPAVWQAVLYPFFMILLSTQIAILVFHIFRCRGGSTTLKKDNRQSTEMGTKKHETIAQTSSAHSTITPADSESKRDSYQAPPTKKDPPSYEESASRPQSAQIQYLREEDAEN